MNYNKDIFDKGCPSSILNTSNSELKYVIFTVLKDRQGTKPLLDIRNDGVLVTYYAPYYIRTFPSLTQCNNIGSEKLQQKQVWIYKPINSKNWLVRDHNMKL